MAKQGFRVMDSDLHVIEPPDLWTNYLDPRFRDRIETGPGGDGQMHARVDGKVLPPYADRPERQRAWSFRTRTSAWQRISRNTPPKAVLEAMDAEGIDVGILFRRASGRSCGTTAPGSTSCEPSRQLAKCPIRWIR